MKSTIPLPPPPENEFEQICQRIEKENRMEQIDGFLWNIIFSARKDTPHAKPKRKISAFYDWPIRRRPAGKISVDCNCHIGSSKLLYTFLLVWLIDPQCADHPFGNSLFSDFFPEHYQAQSGNKRICRLHFQVSERLKGWRFHLEERRRYKIFSCPGCKQKIRIPRNHGKVSIRCPKCGHDFIKNTGAKK